MAHHLVKDGDGSYVFSPKNVARWLQPLAPARVFFRAPWPHQTESTGASLCIDNGQATAALTVRACV
jgi:hypothetical protein